MTTKRKITASTFIGLTGTTNTDAKKLLAERDARALLDNRTPAQRWLNDPPPDRSALHQVGTAGSAGRSASGTRVDMWRKPRWPGHTL
jgi:hypothetical protein